MRDLLVRKFTSLLLKTHTPRSFQQYLESVSSDLNFADIEILKLSLLMFCYIEMPCDIA